MDKAGDEYANRVLNEKCPLTREIWAEGYTKIEEDPRMDAIRLHGPGIFKEIKMNDLRKVISTLTFKTGVLPDGSLHRWICEADGSANKFRTLISPSNGQI